jgi:hypothetical protein
MRNYFKELLQTLKEIEKHLKRLDGCVYDGDEKMGYNSKRRIITGHWND